MKCPDCGIEVEKLNKSGICRQCAVRKTNAKYHNVTYVPLIKLKGTPEYHKAMCRRSRNPVKTKKTTSKTTNNIIKSVQSETKSLDLIKKKAKEEVLKDIQHFRDKKDIKDLLTNQQQLVAAFDFLYMILNNDLDRNIDLNKQIFDSLMLDYFHEVKPNNQFDSLEAYALHGAKEAYLQELRTPIIYLDKINSILDKAFALLKIDVNFMSNLKDVKTELDEYLKGLDNQKYLTTTPSMQKYDFVINKDKEEIRNISKPHIQNKYSARLKKVRGLYGDMNYKPFEYKPPIYADTEEQAKEKFVEVLLKDFGSLSYDTDDIQISLYTEKECL